jgi:hypothetical protein
LKKQKLIFLLVGIIVITEFGCEKETIEPDPAKTILGKWEITQMGNWPNMFRVVANGYVEYLPDSVMREYKYENGQSFYKMYWVDSLYHEKMMREDGVAIILNKSKLCFSDKNNILRLDLMYPSTFNTTIHMRIK